MRSLGPADVDEVTRFPNRTAQVFMLVFGLALAFMGWGGLNSHDATGWAYIVCGLLLAFRGWTTSVLVLSTEEVEWRGIVRRRRVRLDALASATVETGYLTLSPIKKSYLELVRRDGTKLPLRDFNAWPRANRITVVDRAAAAISAALRNGWVSGGS